MTRVKNVVTKQGTDISDLINAEVEAHGGDPLGLLAGLISESNLNERAERWGRRSNEAMECIRVLQEVGEWPPT